MMIHQSINLYNGSSYSLGKIGTFVQSSEKSPDQEVVFDSLLVAAAHTLTGAGY
jgi:hypothetical protein